MPVWFVLLKGPLIVYWYACFLALLKTTCFVMTFDHDRIYTCIYHPNHIYTCSLFLLAFSISFMVHTFTPLIHMVSFLIHVFFQIFYIFLYTLFCSYYLDKEYFLKLVAYALLLFTLVRSTTTKSQQTEHLYNIYAMLDQRRRRRWAEVV